MTITRRVRKRITISSTEVNIELHRSLNNALVSKSSTSKKTLDILFLGYKKAIRGRRDFNPKKVAKRSKIRHKKLLTKTVHYKGNILGVIPRDDHVINIEKKKSPTTRRKVNKQCWIMSTC